MWDGDKRCGCGLGHETFGACLRAKGVQVAGPDHQHFVDRNRVLGRYQSAREQGMQPQSPMTRHVEAAVRKSDAAGEPFRA